MKATFGYQHFDTDPDEIEKHDTWVDLVEAVELFNAFPWENQFEKIQKREESDLTSTTPTIYFYKTETLFLSISAVDNSGFFIQYIKGAEVAQLFLSNDILERPPSISIEQLIADFFNGNLKNKLEFFSFENQYSEGVKYELNYNKGKLLRPLLFMLVPFIFLFFDQNDQALTLPSILVMSLLTLPFIIPVLILNYSYWKNDSDQTLKYEPDKKILTVTTKNKSFNIPKSTLLSVELIRGRQPRRLLRGYGYVRFKSPELSFIVTHLTVNPLDLLTELNVNFKEVEVFFPRIKLDVETPKDKKNKQEYFEKKRKVFLQNYANWETEKLKEVVSKPDRYADYAISAANEILKTRQMK